MSSRYVRVMTRRLEGWTYFIEVINEANILGLLNWEKTQTIGERCKLLHGPSHSQGSLCPRATTWQL